MLLPDSTILSTGRLPQRPTKLLNSRSSKRFARKMTDGRLLFIALGYCTFTSFRCIEAIGCGILSVYEGNRFWVSGVLSDEFICFMRKEHMDDRCYSVLTHDN